MSPEEIPPFETRPFYLDAVRLRRWDDAAKAAGLATPDLEHFARYLEWAAERAV